MLTFTITWWQWHKSQTVKLSDISKEMHESMITEWNHESQKNVWELEGLDLAIIFSVLGSANLII